MNSVELDDNLLVADIVANKQPTRILKNYIRIDPLTFYADSDFKARFRLTKESFQKLLQITRPHLERANQRGQPIHPSIQLLAALRYYASASFQAVTGDTLGLPQPTVSKIVARVSVVLAAMSNQYIRFPEDLSTTKRDFYYLLPSRNPKFTPFPNVIGCIDCTHVEVVAAGVEDRELYRNRKGRLSINVQAVCDAGLNFTNVVARWPGSVHDSRIFQMSELCAKLENKELGQGWLLGDSGYALQPYLLTPLSNPQTAAEQNYNFCHIQVRNCIERAFGVLKKRWPVLAEPVRQELSNGLATVMACFVLHNFLRRYSDFYAEDEVATNNTDQNFVAVDELSELAEGHSINDGKRTREQLISRYFN